jgi:hypothetical protein
MRVGAQKLVLELLEEEVTECLGCHRTSAKEKRLRYANGRIGTRT